MKQLLIGGTIGVAAGLLLGGAAVYAATYELPWTKNIYNVSDVDRIDRQSVRHSVSVFDDGGNKCYTVNTRTSAGADVAISCVKRGES